MKEVLEITAREKLLDEEAKEKVAQLIAPEHKKV